jgi:hypothetical protein
MAIFLTDVSNNGNDLTNNGADESNSGLPFADSRIAADFEASNTDDMTVSDSTSLSITGDLTIECWVNFESTPSSGNYMFFVAKSDGTQAGNSYSFGLHNNGGTLRLYHEIGDGTDTVGVGVNWTPSAGTWYHVASVYDSSTPDVTFYVDGSTQGSAQSTTQTAIQDVDTGLTLGNYTTDYLDGKLDDVRIWNDVRTSDEISNNYQKHLLGNESNLVAYYPFEQLATGAALFF